jgi:tRNA (mo5U34)-methyltransferase
MVTLRRRAAAAIQRVLPSTPEARALRGRVAGIPYWCHSIDLGCGVVTPGIKTPEYQAKELESLHLPDLRGKSVLDIGAWDGFYSFVAEERGAARVVASDWFAWALDREAKDRYKADCRAAGVPPQGFDRIPGLWRGEELPGKRGFDLARAARNSRVEPLVADYMTLNPADVGQFDVVLYLGVLYHMEDPLAALRRVRELTGGVAIVETEAIAIGGFERRAMSEFFPPDAKLSDDPTNFWAPNAPCLVALCQTAGFSRVEVLTPPPAAASGRLLRYRLVAHAFA